MLTVHNTQNDDVLDVPEFVVEKLLEEGKVFKCGECTMYHTDELVASPKKTLREAYQLALN